MRAEYNRVQVIMLEQLHRTFEHDTAHLSRYEQASLAIAAAQSFSDTASKLLEDETREVLAIPNFLRDQENLRAERAADDSTPGCIEPVCVDDMNNGADA